MKWTRVLTFVVLAGILRLPLYRTTMSATPGTVGVDQAATSAGNVALGKPVTVTTNGADDNLACHDMTPADITDGSLEYQPASSCAEDGVVAYANVDYNELMRLTITIDLQGLYHVSRVRYNMGDVQRAETWNADRMVTPFGSTGTNPGSSYAGAWTEHSGNVDMSSVTVVLEKTRVSWPTDYLFVGEIEVYGTPADTPIDASLVAYYNFDSGTAADASGYGNHGSIQGTPQVVPGVSGSAFRFGGWYDQDRVIVPASSSLSFVDNFTFSLWFSVQGNTSEDGGGNVSQYGAQTLVAKSGDRSGLTLRVARREEDGLWTPYAQNGNCNISGPCDPGRSKGIFTQAGLGTGLKEWHMVSATHGDGVARLYMDGIL